VTKLLGEDGAECFGKTSQCLFVASPLTGGAGKLPFSGLTPDTSTLESQGSSVDSIRLFVDSSMRSSCIDDGGEGGKDSGRGCCASGISRFLSRSSGDMIGSIASPTGDITSGEVGLGC